MSAAILAVLSGVTLSWWAGALARLAASGCGQMSIWACTADAAPAAGAALVTTVAARAAWLGIAAARRVDALPRIPVPSAVAATTVRAARVVCLDTGDRLAFCAGLWRPRLYVSRGAVERLAADELAAVLAHEEAHLQRRDPLRGLLRRAGADVLFFAPLARHWDHRRRLRAELAADRAAVRRTGVPALAGALLSMVATAPAETAAFGPATGSALDARIAVLTDTAAPADPIPVGTSVVSLVGSLATAAVVLCLAPLALALGLP